MHSFWSQMCWSLWLHFSAVLKSEIKVTFSLIQNALISYKPDIYLPDNLKQTALDCFKKCNHKGDLISCRAPTLLCQTESRCLQRGTASVEKLTCLVGVIRETLLWPFSFVLIVISVFFNQWWNLINWGNWESMKFYEGTIVVAFKQPSLLLWS